LIGGSMTTISREFDSFPPKIFVKILDLWANLDPKSTDNFLQFGKLCYIHKKP
jgi:hypothetical protein